ncbi:MAG: hypothetical protein Q4F39_01800 [Bacteroidia bacterium]|nr:hypothetical protein [Bacteroidia bacterium]
MKRSLTTVILLLASVLSFAQKPADRYNVSLMGMYGWNETWQSHGGVDVTGYLPVSRHFEATAAMEVHGPKTFAVTATARPKFKLPVGELFIDGSVHYRALASYGISDFNLAASVGWRIDYVSVQLGVTSHFTHDLEKGTGRSEDISEPLNLLYRVSFNVRPATSRWNAGGGIANYTDFEYERTWEPMYFLDGHYDVNDRFSVLCRFDLKPAGAFHLTAGFWGASARAGVRYSF